MRMFWLPVTIALVFGVAGRAQSPSTTAKDTGTAKASFADAENQPVGTARLRQAPHGIVLAIELTKAQPGVHALHIHKVGRCDAPSFESAGDHFDLAGKKHGFLNSAGPHAGDLPNLVVAESHKLSAELLVHDVKLAGSLMDADGAALVIHSGKDDYATDPSGDAGSRIACAVIVADGPGGRD
jgi:Cu-Zn family superoxide dismutase